MRIGAQVSYRDLAGFGRRFIDADPEDLKADVIYQIGALQAIAQVCGSTVSYVKPHGALYNTIVTNHDQARAVAEAVHAVDPALPVLGLSGSVFFAEAQDLGLRTVPEAFADRAYRSDGQLVSRRLPNAVLHDVEEIADRVSSMVTAGRVAAADGSMIPITVESVCVHGDSPGAVQIANAVRERMKADGVEITGVHLDAVSKAETAIALQAAKTVGRGVAVGWTKHVVKAVAHVLGVEIHTDGDETVRRRRRRSGSDMNGWTNQIRDVGPRRGAISHGDRALESIHPGGGSSSRSRSFPGSIHPELVTVTASAWAWLSSA